MFAQNTSFEDEGTSGDSGLDKSPLPDHDLIPDEPSSRWQQWYPWIVFAALLIGWPVLTLMTGPSGAEELTEAINGSRLLIYLNSGGVLWIVFFLIWTAQRSLRQPMTGLGFTEPSIVDPLWALAFLFVANITLNGLASILTSLGMAEPEMAFQALLPQSVSEKAGWVLLSISAGVCEESCFRGFLLLQGKRLFGRWAPIVILSSVAFGLGHVYQGWSGAILIFVYGLMFCGLRLWRGSLWPGVWAHIWQDLGAMTMGSGLGG